MVRNYKKKTDRSKIDEKAVEAALLDVQAKVPPHRAALKHNINPQTLYSRIKRRNKAESSDLPESRPANYLNACSTEPTTCLPDDCPVVSPVARSPEQTARRSKYGVNQVFTNQQEIQLAEYILKCSKLNYGLTIVQCRKFAYEYAKKIELRYPTSWEVNQAAGIDWMNGFRLRHPEMSLRKPENTSAARSYGFNKTVVTEFQDLLASVMQKHKFTPNKVFNLDETGITTVLNMPKILAPRAQKQVGQFVSAERGELVTFVGIISAIGLALPPVYVFPRVKYKDSFLSGAPIGSLGLSNKSG